MDGNTPKVGGQSGTMTLTDNSTGKSIDLPVLSYNSPSYLAGVEITGDLMARGTNDLQAVRMVCGPAIMYSANTILAGTGALFFMFRINAGLAVVALLAMPLVAGVTQFFGERIHKLFERVQEQFADLTARAQENLAGTRVVRAYAREPFEEAEFRRHNQAYVDGNRRLIGWTASFFPLDASHTVAAA